jgi:hypothetical protein
LNDRPTSLSSRTHLVLTEIGVRVYITAGYGGFLRGF